MIYAEFANIYDSLMYDFDYNIVSSFIEDILKIENKKVKHVLELGCGTGNLTELICDKYSVDAIDLSEDMLSVAEQKLRNKNVRLFKQDMKNLDIEDKYDLVLSICDSINYLLDEKDVKNLFVKVFMQLNENGLFIFDLNTKNKFENMDNTYVDEVDGVFCVLENFFDAKTDINLYSVNFFENRGELYERFYEEHEERAYSIEFICNALKDAGFKKIKMYDEYKFDENVEESDRIVYVVEK
ncbi:class I SAM-dependent methyltransferase [Peptoniphilus sp. oral taxon 386]|uniref:class I SAM-dependent DNA methyltransferase n=1 Tax=Peptoniphilus sp. oral taxon 386 TaxID=652713 RepID=UPI0001DAA41E|nr:class I SAM-dependent methyltransferase [Peptoniphilus sp. oral taxon 386]EFI41324.1 methyltransferase domain protein [Peptoniphilus sp. oral taxon 386 str. F0131]